MRPIDRCDYCNENPTVFYFHITKGNILKYCKWCVIGFSSKYMGKTYKLINKENFIKYLSMISV